MSNLLGAIEAGGTKFVMCVATGVSADTIVERAVVPTDDPVTTLAACRSFFAPHADRLRSLGIATFGPVDLRTGPTHGTITTTPKPGWSGVSLTDGFAELGVPIAVDTDVNGAALAESRNLGVDRLVYFTIGTGIGGGAVFDGRTVAGRAHPEMGHVTLERHPDDTYAGRCPDHGACTEGLASGPALEERFGVEPGGLGAVVDRVVPLVGWYAGQLAANAYYTLAADRVVMGGGILGIPGCFDAIHAEAHRRVGTYSIRPGAADDWLTEPSLGTDSGLTGALHLAASAAPDR